MKKLGFAVMIFATTITLALPTFADPTTNQNQPTKQESGVMLKGLEATLKNVDTVQSVITVVTVNKIEKTFTIGKDTRIVAVGKPVATLADLKVGDKVRMTYTEDDAGKITVLKIGLPLIVKVHPVPGMPIDAQ